jgi:hypothetical protein
MWRNALFLSFAALFILHSRASGQACNLVVTSSSSSLIKVNATTYTLAYDNQGSIVFSGSTETLGPTLTISAAQGSSCGTWSASVQGNTFIDANNNPPDSWFVLNPGSVVACTPSVSGSTSLQGQQIGGSFSLLVCANPSPAEPINTLVGRSGTIVLGDSTQGTPSVTITVASGFTRQIFADVPPSTLGFDFLISLQRGESTRW